MLRQLPHFKQMLKMVSELIKKQLYSVNLTLHFVCFHVSILF